MPTEIKEQQVKLETFLARVKATSAFHKGDALESQRYWVYVNNMTNGNHAHRTAAMVGESLAGHVLDQVGAYSVQEHYMNVFFEAMGHRQYASKRLAIFVDDLLKGVLPPILGEIPEPSPPTSRSVLN